MEILMVSHANSPLPVIPPDRGQDLLGLEHADTAHLVLFMAGNQFMAMGEIVADFQQQFPEY